MGALVYWPEASRDSAIDFVGFNHCVTLLLKAAGDSISPAVLPSCRCRLYCNIPWHHNPKHLKSSGLPLVAYTMFESTKLPNTWRDFLQEHCDAILVPTRHVRDCFRLSGITKPIKVVSLGIDPEDHGFIPRDATDTRYNFLWQGHNYDREGRKAAGLVERAFTELRKEKRLGDDAWLYLKYRPHQRWSLEIDFLHVGGNITHISRTLSIERLQRLYRMTDCCVNPSHGEGFGLIPLEQMAMGRPVLLTDWSFPFADKRYNVPLDYDLGESPVDWCQKHLAWGRWGYTYNSGGLIAEHIMPSAIRRPANGDMEYGPGGKAEMAPRTIKGTLINWAADWQSRLGLLWQPNLPKHRIMFEHPGYDAHVKLADLKNKMADCYERRAHYAALGAHAAHWVKKEWNLTRIKREFDQALLELAAEGVL